MKYHLFLPYPPPYPPFAASASARENRSIIHSRAAAAFLLFLLMLDGWNGEGGGFQHSPRFFQHSIFLIVNLQAHTDTDYTCIHNYIYTKDTFKIVGKNVCLDCQKYFFERALAPLSPSSSSGASLGTKSMWARKKKRGMRHPSPHSFLGNVRKRSPPPSLRELAWGACVRKYFVFSESFKFFLEGKWVEAGRGVLQLIL